MTSDLLDRVRTAPHARLRLLDAVAATDAAVVRHDLAYRPVVFVNEPDLIREVLVTRAASFEKSQFQQRVMGGAEGSDTGLGNGMLTSTNAVNRRQRALLARVFAQPAVRRHVLDVAALTRHYRDSWAVAGTIELGTAFMDLSARIVARTLFSWDMAPEDEHLIDDLDAIGGLLGRPAVQREAGWADPSLIERPAAHIERRLLSLVAQRRREGRPTGGASAADGASPADGTSQAADVLDVLLAAQAAGDGPAGHAGEVPGQDGDDDRYVLTDQQLRDDIMTLFITGAENPRNALTWTVYLLARHPEAARRVADEVDAAGVADGYLTPESLRALPFTLQVFKESLRLYPPGYAFGRRAVEDVRIGSLALDPGDEVVISPYALHRRPSLFERPDEFLPERFGREREAAMRPYSYLPFGAGPRGCVGGGFAMLQGHVVLAVLLGGLRLGPAPEWPVLPEPRMTLRPGGPVPIVLSGRTAGRAGDA
jgi:cytochrome P450